MAFTDVYASEFTPNFHLLLTDKAVLRPLFNVMFRNGAEIQNFPRYGNLTATEIVGRMSSNNEQALDLSNRACYLKRYGLEVGIDKLDELKMLADPTSPLSQRFAESLAKSYDDHCFDAILGNALIGKDGSGGTAAFDSSMVIDSGGGGTAFSVAKINKGMKALQQQGVDIDRERVFLIIEAEAEEDLLGDQLYTGFEYQGNKYALNGRNLPTIRGLGVVRSQLMPQPTPGSVGRALLIAERALNVVMAEDVTIKTGEDVNRHFNMVSGAYMTIGAVRMEEGLVADIQFAI